MEQTERLGEINAQRSDRVGAGRIAKLLKIRRRYLTNIESNLANQPGGIRKRPNEAWLTDYPNLFKRQQEGDNTAYSRRVYMGLANG